MPEDRRQVEEDSLDEEDEGNPLVIWDVVTFVLRPGHALIHGHIIGVPHPTVTGGIFGMAACRANVTNIKIV